MSGRFSVGGGVLARRVIATADVSALSTPAQMKPPALLFALHTARTAGRQDGEILAVPTAHLSEVALQDSVFGERSCGPF